MKVFTRVRGDVYHSRLVNPVAPQTTLFRGGVARIFGQAGAECRWPLKSRLLIVEPVIQGIVAPYEGLPKKIPNLDSTFEFNDANLFRVDRFPGFDRLDTGSRMTYGATFLTPYAGLHSTRLFLGQSYAFTKPPYDLCGSGVDRKASDFVGNLQSDPHPWLTVDYRFRLSHKKLKTNFSELFTGVGPEVARFGASYVYYRPSQLFMTAPETQLGVEQLCLSLTSHFQKFWTVGVSQLRSLKQEGLLSQGLQLGYQNECVSVRAFIGRSYFRDRNLRPTTTFLITVALKNLGGSPSSTRDMSQNVPGEMGKYFTPFSPSP
jgi:LPS-assembly protein